MVGKQNIIIKNKALTDIFLLYYSNYCITSQH